MPKFQIFFSLFAMSLMLVCVALGIWQMQRLSEKENYLSQLQQRLTATESVALTHAMQDPDDSFYRRLQLSGWWRDSESFFFRAAALNGVAGLGYVTPFDIPAGDGGYHRILIYRGWVPLSWQQKPISRLARQAIQKQVVVMVKPYPEAHWSLPANQPEKKFYVSLEASVRTSLLPEKEQISLVPFMGHLLPGQGGRAGEGQQSLDKGYPVVQAPDLDIPNHHLQYALTWFGLAFVILLLTAVKSGFMSVMNDPKKMFMTGKESI